MASGQIVGQIRALAKPSRARNTIDVLPLDKITPRLKSNPSDAEMVRAVRWEIIFGMGAIPSR